MEEGKAQAEFPILVALNWQANIGHIGEKKKSKEFAV